MFRDIALLIVYKEDCLEQPLKCLVKNFSYYFRRTYILSKNLH